MCKLLSIIHIPISFHASINSTSELTNPFLLFSLKYFIDKISWLVHAKHAHMLRWKRFSEHSSVIEDLYVDLKNRLGFMLAEYNDSVERARRLKIAREALLTSGSCSSAMPFVNREDVVIYQRWLITHIYSQKSFQQCMKVLEWLPHQMSTELMAQDVDGEQNSSSKSGSIKKSFEAIYRKSNNLNSDRNSLSNKKNSLSSYLNVKYKALDSVYLNSTSALVPREEILNSISYSKWLFF